MRFLVSPSDKTRLRTFFLISLNLKFFCHSGFFGLASNREVEDNEPPLQGYYSLELQPPKDKLDSSRCLKVVDKTPDNGVFF